MEMMNADTILIILLVALVKSIMEMVMIFFERD